MHRVCSCADKSVAVLMAGQDVEVAVGCRVVCRPALQHHHPESETTTKKQDVFLGRREGKKRTIPIPQKERLPITITHCPLPLAFQN